MWNNKKSAFVSLVCVYVFMAVLVVCIVLTKLIVESYISWGARPETLFNVLRYSIYASSIPAAVVLVALRQLLTNIVKDKIFIKQNINCIRVISYSIVAFALITFVCGFFYMPYFIISLAAAFMSLIIRVIKNVMAAALEIKSENELTI